jgi:surface polysaccharide O-acyltransferase-like enzyme
LSTNTNTSNNAALDTDHTARRSTETKASTKTTEFFVYLAAVLAVIITAAVVGDGTEGSDAGDLFDANQAMQYITYLTIGYMIARGLAKSGSREHYNTSK